MAVCDDRSDAPPEGCDVTLPAGRWERGPDSGPLSGATTIAPTRPSELQPAPEAVTDRDAPLSAPRAPGSPAPPAPGDVPLPQRGERLACTALIARGGMGEVFRATDRPLRRVLALKALRAELLPDPAIRAVFLDEAQVTAQLAHPGIPPVHEYGELADGRPYFTMKEVHGRTLADVIREVHAAGPDQTQWSEFRLLDVFHHVCEAVAYAHARGVIHCDLKPGNVMVGAFGEVLVMDWGIARLVAPATALASAEPPVGTDRGSSDPRELVAGTPGYMAPEQMAPGKDPLGPPADVYALGVTLYELLAHRRPYGGNTAQVLVSALAGEVPPLPERPGSVADEALWDIIVRAMSPRPADRYPDAGAMAEDVARWREGALQREKALAVVRQAERTLPEAAPKRARAAALRAEAESRLAALGPAAGALGKAEAWALQDAAAALEREAALATVETARLLQAALVHAPDLRAAHALLAHIHFERHREAERRRAWDEAAQHEVLLRAHDVGQYQDYLTGRAALTLVTGPPCRVRLSRYALHDRRFIPTEPQDLGNTPLREVELPVGSYLAELLPDDRPPVRYPLVLRRRGAWRGRRPGAEAPTAIALPEAGALGPDEAYVAAGWFECGGDPAAARALPARRIWLDAFVIQADPVTFRDLAAFLADPAGAPWRSDVLRDGLDLWQPDCPAVGVSWDAACAYARWHAARTGRPWRLPGELEWEKAARGVDGRTFPWGDFADGAFCQARGAERVPLAPARVAAFPTDCSPYGVRGMAGNVRDWCADPFRATGPPVLGGLPVPRSPDDDGDGADAAPERVVRGGSWRQPLDSARAAARAALPRQKGFLDVGFRLARSWPGV